MALFFKEIAQRVRQSGLAYFFDFIAHANKGLVDVQNQAEIDGRSDQNQIARCAVDGLFEFLALLSAVAHRRKQLAQVWILLKRGTDGTNRVGAGIHNFSCPSLSGCDYPRTVLHLAVCQRWTIFNDQDALTFDGFAWPQRNLAGHTHDGRLRIVLFNIALHEFDVRQFGRVHFVDHHDVGATQIHFSGVVSQFMACAVRVSHHNLQIASVETCVVVAAVPQDDVRFFFGGAENLLVVDSRVNHRAVLKMRLVFFPFLDRAFIAIQIFAVGEALYGLRLQISIGHRVANDNRLPTVVPEFPRDEPRNGTLSAAGSHGAYRNHGNSRFHLGVFGAEEPEIRACRDTARGQVHYRGVGHIAIGKYNYIHTLPLNHFFQVVFLEDGNPPRISAPCQNWWISAARNVGNLCCRKCDHVKFGMVAKNE